jgi:hypothetical protein
MQIKLLGIINVDFDITDDEQLNRFSESGRYWRKNGRIKGQYISYL